MLSNAKLILVFISLFIYVGCEFDKNSSSLDEKETEFKNKVNHVLSDSVGYELLYKKMTDSLIDWTENDLLSLNQYGYTLIIDSVFCVNSEGNKLIGAQLRSHGLGIKYSADGIQEFFGAKIKGEWYFWTGGYMPVIRKSFKNHDPSKPLSYAQLHGEAMSSFLGGYLTKDGEINDKWFESKFKDGYTPFEQRYKYKYILDGQRIDNEKQYYEYLWKRKGLILWITKLSKDSIAEVNNLGGEKLSRDQENEIRMVISRKMLAQ